MLQQDSIVLKRDPFLPVLFAKAALKRGRNLSPDLQLPALRVSAAGVKADSGRLRRYQKVCGFQEKNVLPLTYPQIMAFGPYMRLLTDARFPLPLIGLVHLRNEITQYRPILPEEVLDFECSIAGQRHTDKGLEFDILTRVSSVGRVVWESNSTILHRIKQRGERRKHKEKPPSAYEHRMFWQLPEDLGRHYARVSGDYNLIHLYAVTARFFGFKRPIVHGMWSKARIVAQLLNGRHEGPVRVAVSFKLPVFLPGAVDLVWRWHGKTAQFELLGHKNGKPHLEGTLELLG